MTAQISLTVRTAQSIPLRSKLKRLPAKLSTKLFSYRVVQSSIRPTEDQKILLWVCSRSGSTSRINVQRFLAHGKNRGSRRAYRHQCRRTKRGAPMSSKLQGMPRQPRRNSCGSVRVHHLRH